MPGITRCRRQEGRESKRLPEALGALALGPVDKLTEIMNAKRREIAPFARAVTDAELAAFAGKQSTPGFRQSLQVQGRLSVIAEVKRASPSVDRKSTRLNSSHLKLARMPSSA